MTFYIFENISIFCGILLSNMYTLYVSLEIPLESVEGLPKSLGIWVSGDTKNTAAILEGDTQNSGIPKIITDTGPIFYVTV